MIPHRDRDFRSPPEIGHVQSESPVTLLRNDRSRSIGTGGHVPPETSVTLVRNTQPKGAYRTCRRSHLSQPYDRHPVGKRAGPATPLSGFRQATWASVPATEADATHLRDDLSNVGRQSRICRSSAWTRFIEDAVRGVLEMDRGSRQGTGARKSGAWIGSLSGAPRNATR